MKKILMILLAVAFAGAVGCASKQQKAEPVPQPMAVEKPAPVQPAPKPAPTPMEIYEMNYKQLPSSHTVVKGECLWRISEQAQIYNDPFMWPLIYKANRDKITKSPNLIYPGQVFSIPRDGFTLADIQSARVQAGAAKKKANPAATANLPAGIRQELGYGF
ncbi:Peptidoglycan-binding lysin domain-containing protein [Desulfovibrio sp. X2]|uniref:LysM peptidoglycan-binding domain-containing protein n=1 Tax=Desulfovibrio sp. X2 TaxID=941449 RepID=UPI000358C28B|nr:LysM peptidoglycan-binding domain-containing protein [Desulfovibrio sp. X2]EPR43992.1 Peptidoglycan-binding lysin domain-containing protein [Desulfovibrio sp. X2]